MPNQPTGRSEGLSLTATRSAAGSGHRERDRAELDSRWSDQEGALGAGPLHRVITAQALARPEAPAIVTAEQHIAYRDLDHWTLQIARHLRALGVGPETTVGLAFERSTDYLIAMLSVMKAGGAYVTLDPLLPREAWVSRLEATDCRMIISSARLLPDLPETDTRILCLDAAWRIMAQGVTAPVDEGLAPENLAYALYSCGSKPIPEGLQISHRTLFHLATASRNLYALEPDDRVLLLSPFEEAFVATEIFPVWLAGATLITLPDLLWSFSQLLDYIEAQEITVIHLPIETWKTLLEELEQGRFPLPKTLRQVIISEEVLTPERLRIWHQHVGQRIALCTTFGTREAVPSIDAGRALASLTAPENGQAAPDVRAYILDSDLRPINPKCTGELAIAGSVPGRGYFANPRLTAESFVPDPLSCKQGGRIFRSGHRVHLHCDGVLEFRPQPRRKSSRPNHQPRSSSPNRTDERLETTAPDAEETGHAIGSQRGNKRQVKAPELVH